LIVTARLIFLSLAFALSLGTRLDALEFTVVTNGGKRASICWVDLRVDSLKLFLRDDRGRPLKSFTGLERLLKARDQKLLFAMNAGMYQSDLSPVGLCVVDGRQLTSLNLADGIGNFFLKPNGVFLVTGNGARIIESSKYAALASPMWLATQSGPLLVLGGEVHPKFNARSTSRLIRNGVGVKASGEVVFALTEDPMNFHELATLFRDRLKCPDALYLDGVISSLYSLPLKRSDKGTDLGPIIAVVQ
jgi:uncharacterized protein YigE (DUF2233 family)